VIAIIRNGRVPPVDNPAGPPPPLYMPSWKHVLSDEDINRIADYLWSKQQKKDSEEIQVEAEKLEVLHHPRDVARYLSEGQVHVLIGLREARTGQRGLHDAAGKDFGSQAGLRLHARSNDGLLGADSEVTTHAGMRPQPPGKACQELRRKCDINDPRSLKKRNRGEGLACRPRHMGTGPRRRSAARSAPERARSAATRWRCGR